MNSKERVKRAIRFENPDKVPIFMFNRDFEYSDIAMLTYARADNFVPSTEGETEWGYVQVSVDKTAGQVVYSPVQDWDNLVNYKAPDPELPERYTHIEKYCKEHPEMYTLGNLGISGFSMLTFLHGFEQTMEDFYLEEDKINELLDIIFQTETRLIEHMLDAGVDAISFYDDWGSQRSLLISKKMWDKFFKERYRKQFAVIKSRGKDIFFHSCGHVLDIIEDMISLGVDMFNFNGLDVMGMDNLAKYRGKVTFCCPVDLQSVAIKADRQTIFDYTQRMITNLGTEKGGYIGYIEEYSSIGLTDENYYNCLDAYLELGKYQRK